MNITIIGTGYVGLVSGICFAEFGFNITCVDKEVKKIQKLQDGEVPIYEPGLEAMLKRNIDANRIAFTTKLESAVRSADIVFIAVGTPSRRGDGHADLSFVFNAAEEIAKSINGYSLIVTKSTVPVGTGNKVREIIEESYELGIKKLVLITGKGIHSENEKDPYVSKDLGILKNSVPEYIKHNDQLMNKINDIVHADIKDGGSGAFYIFLKRKL